MKILRLDLRAFGPFTDVTLNLDAGDHGLHVVHGPNEAGKSATLRALRQFIYGIPERTPDAFRHPYEKLRIAALLRHSDGSVLECIRRKARTNALRGPDDKSIVDSGVLGHFIAGVDQAFFETMFGIDHKTLVQGGHDIVQGGGHLGQVLFAAGSGIADLRAVQERLQTEISDLFRPAGRTQRINKALGDLRETQAAIKRQQLSAEEWARHDRDLREAEQQKQQVETQRQQKSRELNHLVRIRDALPAIARRKELLTEWAGFRDAVLLPADFPEKRQSALETLAVAEDQSQQAQHALERIEHELRQLDVPERLLEQADQIEDLHRRLGEYQKDMKDRPVRVIQAKNLEHDAKVILRSLRRPAELEESEHLRLSVDEPLKIQNLGTQQQGLVNRCDSARQARLDLVSRRELAEQVLAGLAAPRDPAELRRLARTVQNEGPLEEQRAAAQDRIRQAEKQAAIDLSRLTLWSGPQEALEGLALPAPETVDRFESELNEHNAVRGQLGERAHEVEEELRELEGQIERLEREQAVPSEEDLQRARQLRDAGWRLVRRAWLEQTPAGPEATEFLAQFAPAGDLADAYERSAERADTVADRLRREANRVAGKAKLVVDHGQRRDQLDKLNGQLRETENQLSQLDGQLKALWQPLGIQPLPPREMRAWLRKQGEFTRQLQALREQREHASRLEERIHAWRRRLGSCLRNLGEADAGPDETLVAVLERSQEVVDHFDGVKRERERLEREIAGNAQELRVADARLRQAEEDHARWQEQWAAAMARLGLETNASAAQANAVLAAITTLFQKLHEADGFQRRIDGIDRDAAQFRADLQETARLAAPELASLEVEAAERELYSRLQPARSARHSQQNLQKQRELEAGKLRKAQENLAAIGRRLEAMCREAGCAAHEELPRAEQRSARR